MLIDWYTFIIQIINFIILIWILKHFLYRPILNAIDTRKNQINEVLQEAKKQEEGAIQERALFLAKNKDYDNEIENKKRKIVEEIEKIKDELLNNAKNEVEQRKLRWESGLQTEKETAYFQLKDRFQTEIFSTIRKILQGLSGLSLEECVIATFLEQFKKLAKEKNLSQYIEPSRPLYVKTGIELSEQMREKILNAIFQETGKRMSADFVIDKGLIAGIEVLVNNEKISWNVADDLSSLQKRLEKVLALKG